MPQGILAMGLVLICLLSIRVILNILQFLNVNQWINNNWSLFLRLVLCGFKITVVFAMSVYTGRIIGVLGMSYGIIGILFLAELIAFFESMALNFYPTTQSFYVNVAKIAASASATIFLFHLSLSTSNMRCIGLLVVLGMFLTYLTSIVDYREEEAAPVPSEPKEGSAIDRSSNRFQAVVESLLNWPDRR